ncbi:MAG: hypothetical protein M3P40_00025 [Actinomycetota bacterium]|nr:hypothetical protein [Actinomycetota bacterium]
MHRFCGAVSVTGAAVLFIAFLRHEDWPAVWSLSALLLAVGVLIGELLPLKIPRHGDSEVITISTTFTFALLLSAGLVPALVAQITASTVQDVFARKTPWRMTFNIGQYTLSLAATAWVLRELAGGSPRRSPRCWRAMTSNRRAFCSKSPRARSWPTPTSRPRRSAS